MMLPLVYGVVARRVWRGLRGLLGSRTGQVLVGLGLLAGIGYWGYRQYEHERQQRILAELALRGQMTVIQEGLRTLQRTEARLAARDLAADSLVSAVAAAKQLNGDLIAAVQLLVAARETTVQHDALPTTTSDSTRSATFEDSTFAGTISGTVTAPPFPAALGLTYTVRRPAFAPEVGFVQVGDSVVTTVSWRGEEVSLTAPFARPQPPRPPVLRASAAGVYRLGPDPGLEARAGLGLRLPHAFSLEAWLEQPLHPVELPAPTVTVGFRKDFRVF